MAYSWQTDPNPKKSHEEQSEHQEIHSANQTIFASQVSLGFDQLVNDINNKMPLYPSGVEENTFGVPSAPNWDSKWHSLYGTHQVYLNEFPSKSSQLSCHSVGKPSPIGFSPSVLPKPQIVNKESFWGNPRGKYHGANDSRFDVLAPSSSSDPQGKLENENHNYCIGFESSIPVVYPSFSTDFVPNKKHERSGNVNIVEPSLALFKGSFLPRTWESMGQENMEVCIIYVNLKYERIIQQYIGLIGKEGYSS
jgi:phosphatidylinositol-4-phosphate 3-kinase